MRVFFLFFLFSTSLSAQIIQNVEIEVVGRPSWQTIIPFGKDGMLLLTKTDQTKAKVVMFDADLNKKWETDIFLDVERSPTSYSFDKEQITFLFRETRGMYYQVYIFDLATGKYQNKGFEVREFFDDQNYIFLKNKILMAGATTKGAGFYSFDFESEEGKVIEIDIRGKVVLQDLKFVEKSNLIKTIWSVKELAYSNPKRKKGEYVKDAYLAIADFDTSGKVLNISKITQKSGNFPMTAKSLTMLDGRELISGTYQNKTGDNGLFIAFRNQSEISTPSFISYARFLYGNTDSNRDELKKLLKDYRFLMHFPVENDGFFSVGGVFFKPEFQSRQVSDAYSSSSAATRGISFGRPSSRTQTLLAGYTYLTGFVANIKPNGELLNTNKIDIKQSSTQLRQTLSFNSAGAVAYCIKGDLAARNFNIGTKPILYKLSDEDKSVSNQSYLPAYQEVRFWYDNYFVANGAKNKIEVLKLEKKGPFKKKKKNQNSTFTQVRKTIYLTKIASGISD
ncbi:hypothetical protein EGI22_12395 [Lacihabitans sp. LS3-19]|uniref:hypothetical protein n=1 Tax=Lacihabitans sp. LS3-19 TaxID=2487335 RepID=UPI0020CF287B|nr:hypothetical protein [Lacihabitans sp. LS3-19]MCP9768717.1 hypothetical protein [Lacihabitans sp. LS3-19]